MDDGIARLQAMITRSRRAVAFTGAGISTESGIPDFRSPGGLWTRQAPICFDEFLRSEAAQQESWRRRFESDIILREARPNRGHRALARLVAQGRLSAVITQNIDGLHQMSGVPPDRVIELHGNTTYALCLDCERRYEIADLRIGFERDGRAPRCADCAGPIKTATVSFGQPMPAQAMRQAEAEALECDLMLTIGSSLVVYPAAGLPALAKRNGAGLVIINREPTGLDADADLVLHRAIGETLGAAVDVA